MAATRTPRRPARGARRAPPRRRTRNRRSPWPRRLFALAAIAGVGLAAYAIIGGVFEKAVRELTLPLRHEDIIRQQAAEKEVDAALIAGVIFAESRFRDQTSSAGARGLMQITRGTADHIERESGGSTFEFEDLADPDINIRYGTFYLRELLNVYEGNEVAALAAYNAGPSNAESWGGSSMELDDIEFAETRSYVAQVLDKRDDYRRAYGRELGY
ncbi:MAG TPA: lytic transglycosylase domain-containing protein [Solirubrobacterales bacterium]|nr:lytic transglycosylase domain-containing protein [Solirubrobacterales bacterium]